MRKQNGRTLNNCSLNMAGQFNVCFALFIMFAIFKNQPLPIPAYYDTFSNGVLKNISHQSID